MSINAITLVIADSGAVVGWTITAVLTFLLIGVPVLYLFVLTLADDDDAFDRRVRDIDHYVDLRNRAQRLAAADAVSAPVLPKVQAPPLKRVPRPARPIPRAAASRDRLTTT